MPIYLVERYLPGVTVPELTALQRAVVDATGKSARGGQPVTYLRSILLPGESRCLCLFEAPSAAIIGTVNDNAGFTYSRILNALDVTPDALTARIRLSKPERK